MIPKEGYIFFIVNPKSGATSSKVLVNHFKRYLLDNGYEIKLTYTKSLKHARELALEEATKYDCKLVVGAGGDGTIREIAHGLEGSDKPLLMLPCGTENLLASELGFDEKPETAIKAFDEFYTRFLDLGKVGEQFFTSISGYGFDGSIVRRVTQIRKGHIHHLDYFWPIWRTFWDYKFPPIKIEADGKELYNGPAMVFVGNISRYAIGLQILSQADFGDGMLDVCIYKCSNQLELVRASVLTVLKSHSNSKSVIYTKAKNIRISSDVEVYTEIDGDPGPNLPVEITVVPQAVKLVVPKGAKPAGMRTRLMRMLG
jgi:YegS/Rv2252/BmrU family lipid kinase